MHDEGLVRLTLQPCDSLGFAEIGPKPRPRGPEREHPPVDPRPHRELPGLRGHRPPVNVPNAPEGAHERAKGGADQHVGQQRSGPRWVYPSDDGAEELPRRVRRARVGQRPHREHEPRHQAVVHEGQGPKDHGVDRAQHRAIRDPLHCRLQRGDHSPPGGLLPWLSGSFVRLGTPPRNSIPLPVVTVHVMSGEHGCVHFLPPFAPDLAVELRVRVRLQGAAIEVLAVERRRVSLVCPKGIGRIIHVVQYLDTNIHNLLPVR
mmetsp:Transcript_10784/g.27745  ORF Transcript_10784/g.27745 Transcript_10784/m.27745 type:complete len:261 (-) Transcript_10784:740-1522(-)